MMKNQGVSEAVAMDIVGHETRAISANYTHIEESSRLDAILRLPSFAVTTAALPAPSVIESAA
jgi:hypothetical protein